MKKLRLKEVNLNQAFETVEKEWQEKMLNDFDFGIYWNELTDLGKLRYFSKQAKSLIIAEFEKSVKREDGNVT